MDHLALLGEAQHAADRAARAGDDGALGARAAARDGTATAVEEAQLHAELGRHLAQPHLRALQRPACRHEAAVLGAVAVAEHHPLQVATRLKVGAPARVGEQVAQGVRGSREVVHGLEQRGHVEGHAAERVHQTRPSRQGQHRQRVLGAAAHTDDVQAEGTGAIARPAFDDRAEHLAHAQRGRRVLRQRARGQRLAGLDHRQRFIERRVQAVDAGGAVAFDEVRFAEPFADGLPMHVGVLAEVERGQMEAEGRHATTHAAQREHAGVLATTAEQAVLDEREVGIERGGVGIARQPVLARRREPRLHEAEERAIGRVLVLQGLRPARGVLLQAGFETGTEGHAGARLRQHRLQVLDVADVGG